MSACGSNTITSDRYNDTIDWLGNQLDKWQKGSLPWITTAVRVALVGKAILLAPQITLISLAAGAAVGFRWPGAYDMNIQHMTIGCLQNFWDLMANRQQPVALSMVIMTAETLHCLMHQKIMFSFLMGYTTGQYVGKEINARVKAWR